VRWWRRSRPASKRMMGRGVGAVICLACLGWPGGGQAQAAMGWMSVDSRGVAVPAPNQTACEERNPSSKTDSIEYRKVFEDGMNCNFEIANTCLWNIVPHSVPRKFGEDGLAILVANRRHYQKSKEEWRWKSKDGTIGEKNKGHYLIFQANYIDSANTGCSPSFSHIESPWIEQSDTECELKFDFFYGCWELCSNE